MGTEVTVLLLLCHTWDTVFDNTSLNFIFWLIDLPEYDFKVILWYYGNCGHIFLNLTWKVSGWLKKTLQVIGIEDK